MESCSLLAATQGNVGLESIVWDTGVPAECWPCINRALADSAEVHEEVFPPPLHPGEDLASLEKWHCVGLRHDEEPAHRTVIEEVGIDDDGTNEGGLLSRRIAHFTCPNACETESN